MIGNQLAGFLELVKILNAAPSLAGAKVGYKTSCLAKLCSGYTGRKPESHH